MGGKRVPAATRECKSAVWSRKQTRSGLSCAGGGGSGDRGWAGLTGQPVDVDVRGLGEGWESRCGGTAGGSKAVGVRGEAVPTPRLSHPAP